MEDELESWVRSRLPAREIVLSRRRPWASVWRVETVEGTWWAKANSEATGFEPRLLALLTQLDPALLPDAITHDSRPWQLTADAGRPARDLLADADPATVLAFWSGLLPRYAELQRAAPAGGLRALDVPDLSPARLTEVFDGLLADERWFTPEVAPDHDHEALARLRSVRPRLAVAADELAQGLPPGVQHDDLHDGNVFARSGAVRVIDWGDASLAHPFGTLRVTLDGLSRRLGLAPGSAELRRVTSAYLEPWLAAGESRADLERQLDLAVRVAGVGRAASWARALGSPEAGRPLGFDGAVADWMVQLADDLDQPATG